MTVKELPFTLEQIKEIIRQYPTPFHIYDEKAIRENARLLNSVFSWNKGFREFFAVKATPNPYLLKISRRRVLAVTAVQWQSLFLRKKQVLKGMILFLLQITLPPKNILRQKNCGAVINLDDITHISYLEKNAGMPELICLRYNPGALKEGNLIIGHPEESKYGFMREQLFEGYKEAK